MPPWLQELLVVALPIVVSTYATIAVLGSKIDAQGKMIEQLDEKKLDTSVHAVEIKRIDGRVDGAYEEVRRERVRLNNMLLADRRHNDEGHP